MRELDLILKTLDRAGSNINLTEKLREGESVAPGPRSQWKNFALFTLIFVVLLNFDLAPFNIIIIIINHLFPKNWRGKLRLSTFPLESVFDLLVGLKFFRALIY